MWIGSRATRALAFAPLLLGGCTATVTSVEVKSPPPPYLEASPTSVLGTPFLLAMKVPGCAISLAWGAPLAAVYTLANRGEIPPEQDFRVDAERAVETYCGPPYAVPP